jgi:DNA modification methylase
MGEIVNIILNADALHIPLADETVQCVVTSPPYWGLRDYGTAKWEGGDMNCTHNPQRPDGGQRADRSLPLGRGGMYRDICTKCGATRIDAQLGLEPTPEEYVANMVAVFREVWRVLRKDGVVWLNLGDSYAGDGKGSNNGRDKSTLSGGFDTQESVPLRRDKRGNNLKPKDLVGIPWRVAFALQADGWWLRSEIIWHKPNPMPESVTDRPTKAHEQVFLLAKAQKYFYDAEAVREANTEGSRERFENGAPRKRTDNRNGTPYDWQRDDAVTSMNGRNRRTVWTIATAPYSGAHFATFPPDLVRPCILAGTSPRACEVCGAPWERVVERTPGISKECPKTDNAHIARGGTGKPIGTVGKSGSGRIDGYSTTTGFRPTCACANEGTGRSIVLDPFAGTFTVGMVAAEYGRAAVGIELSREYINLALERTAQARMQGVFLLL